MKRIARWWKDPVAVGGVDPSGRARPEELAGLITGGAATDRITTAARAAGMRSLREDTLDPEALARSHPLWAAEVDRRGAGLVLMHMQGTPRTMQLAPSYENVVGEVAEELHLSPSTVETHRRNLLIKLGARNTAGLVRVALEYSLLD